MVVRVREFISLIWNTRVENERNFLFDQPGYMSVGKLCRVAFGFAWDGLDAKLCLSFDQGEYNSFYYAEEVLSTYEYKQLIKANDRATMLNLMVGLNGYTLCSGIICEELNGDNYCAVKLDSDERMEIGYISRKGAVVSAIGQKYLEEISKSRAL